MPWTWWAWRAGGSRPPSWWASCSAWTCTATTRRTFRHVPPERQPKSLLPGQVLRIHDILVWIRIWIWIRRSMTLTSGSGSGSCFFRHWPSRRQQKTNLKKKFFCLLLFEGTFKSFFKDKKSKRSHKTEGRNQGFSYYFWLIEGSGSGYGSISLIRIQVAQKHTDPMDPDLDSDPDPQHWVKA